MNKVLLYGVLSLLLVGTVAAAGMLIRASTPASGLNDQAFYAYQAGDLDAAEALYRKALTLEPEYELARYNLALLYNEEKEYGKALEHLELLLAQDRKNPHYQYDYAVNLVEEMRASQAWERTTFEEAIAHYEAADELEPGFLRARENVAFLREMVTEYFA